MPILGSQRTMLADMLSDGERDLLASDGEGDRMSGASEVLRSEDEGSVAHSASSQEIIPDDGDPIVEEEPSLIPDDEATGMQGTTDALTWIPGVNTGRHIGRGAPVGVQAEVLITNVIHNLQKLGKSALRSMQSILSVALHKKRSMAFRISSYLLGLPALTLEQVYRRVRDSVWQPASAATSAATSSASVQGGLSPDEEAASVRNAVSLALGNAVDGNSHRDLYKVLARAVLAGANVSMAATSVDFSRVVVAFASVVVSQLDADDFNSDLPGLGIPSDFAILADPVSLGVGVQGRHDTLCVICLCIISRWTGRPYTPMLSSPAMAIGAHGGDEMKELLLWSLRTHPAKFTERILRARCSAVSGDGQLCQGGPDARHRSSKAAEKLWYTLYPDASPAGPPCEAACPPLEAACPAVCTVWDPFHRVDNAAWRAISAVPMAVLVFETSKQLDYIFGQSEGVVFFRGVAQELGESCRAMRAPGGTRKVGYLSGTPGLILENLKKVVGGLHVRVAWNQEGHRNQSIEHLMRLSRTVCDVSFIIFACILADILRLGVRPFAIQVQGVLEPAVFKRCEKRTLFFLDNSKRLVPCMRGLLRVVALLRQYAPVSDLCNLVAAFRWTAMGRCFPTLFDALPTILAEKPTYAGIP